MGTIFHNAFVTIAATSASSMVEGFVRRPTCERMHLHPLLTDVRSGENGGSQPLDLILRYPQYDPEEMIRRSLWNKRGWIFQERKLSRRALHFTQGTVYFECVSGCKCEWKDMRPDLHSITYDEDIMYDPAWQPRCFRGPMLDFSAWYGEVAQFSARIFTVPEDKLPAILGLSDIAARTLKS